MKGPSRLLFRISKPIEVPGERALFRPGLTLRFVAALLLLAVIAAPAYARDIVRSKEMARTQFAKAEKMREALNGIAPGSRTRTDYQRVTDAFRRVYYVAPTSSKADSAVLAVAELLAESGRAFEDQKALRSAIGQYEFLRREYPGSKYRVDALFTIAQIYQQDLRDTANAKATFQEFLKHYPHSHLGNEARISLAELEHPVPAPARVPQRENVAERAVEKPAGHLPLVTGVRHWSTPDYTRVAIDLEGEVKYEAGRIPSPDRIFFDLQDAKLASTLVGKSFDVQDGLLRKIRVAQYQLRMTRVVLEVSDVADYSAFLLPNPYRLIIDIHGKQSAKPQTAIARKEAAREAREVKGTETAPQGAKIQPQSPVREVPAPVVARTTEEPTKSPLARPEPNAAVGAQPEQRLNSREPAKTSEPRVATKTTPTPETVAKTTPPELTPTEVKSTAKPTSGPTFASVAPRTLPASNKKTHEPPAHTASPSSDGERTLIRALGLKIGRIVVDAGHGGHDTGTIGPNGLQEKDLVLDVALRLGKLLQTKLGAEVVYTRDDDTFIPLETRTAIANRAQADLFISIHANSSNDPAARGVETYYLNFTSSADALEVAARENAVSEKSIHELQDLVKKITLKEKINESREFAIDVQRSLWTGVAAKNPTVRNRGVKKAPFIVLIGANMPSVLAEISFLSNPTDEKRLQTPAYRQNVADYLYRGIQKYVNGLSGVKVASTHTETKGGGVQ